MARFVGRRRDDGDAQYAMERDQEGFLGMNDPMPVPIEEEAPPTPSPVGKPSMSIKLMEFSRPQEGIGRGEFPYAKYELQHCNPGREGTCLNVDLKFTFLFNEINVTADFGRAKVDSVDGGFDKMADWFERAAAALRQRKPAPLQLPLWKDS